MAHPINTGTEARLRCKDFVKACSKAFALGIEGLLGRGGIVTFPASERAKRSLCKTFQARNRLCFDDSSLLDCQRVIRAVVFDLKA
jgi:hypothetical protein